MHSTDIMYGDPFPEKGHPQPEQYNFFHSGDFSGNVMFNVEAYHVKELYAADSPYARHGQAIVEITVPFYVLAELVAKAVKEHKEAELERMDPMVPLGLRRER